MIHEHATRRIALTLAGLGIVLAACSLPPDEYLVPITTASDDAKELYIEGRERVENLHLADGRALFEQAIQKDPGFALAHLALANTAATTTAVFEHLDQAVARIESVSEGERLMILGAEAGAKGDVATQLEHYSRLVEAFPEDERVQTLLGRFHFCQREYSEATTRLKSALRLNPGFAPPYNIMGYSQQFLGLFDQAEQALETYIELLPTEPNPHDSYAEMLMKQGRFEEAVAAYEKALGLDPEFVTSLIGIGNVRMFQGRFDDARDRFKQVLEGATDDGQRRQALFWMAASHVHEGNPDGALDTLRDMSTLAETAGDLAAMADDLNLIGDVLYEAGRLDEAATHYDRAAETMDRADVPDEVKAGARRIRTFNSLRLAVARGQVDEVREQLSSFRRTISESNARNDFRMYYEIAGLLALARKDYEPAIRAFSRDDQHNPRILYLAAEAHRGAGNPQEARRVGNRAARFNGLTFDYAYVRRKAEKLLDELQ